MSKICKTCNISKDILEFPKGRNSCKKCFNHYMKLRRPTKSRIKSLIENYKICLKCNVEKHIDNFNKTNRWCKECNRNRIKEYRNKKDNSKQYIYIIINDAWGNYIKIGRTSDVNSRLQTYSPLRDYKLYFYKQVEDPYFIETYFSKNYNSFNEWVIIDKDEAIKIIHDMS